DYRAINDITQKEIEPPPPIDEILDGLGKAKVFTKLDLESGYHQIKMAEESREYTAFTTHFGKFQYRQMPFGLCNAPATFQELMYAALREHIGIRCYAYMDNVIIFSETNEQHKKNLREVLRTLARWKLKINREKSEFKVTEIDFLGYRISNNIIKPDQGAIANYQRRILVRHPKELQKALGVIGYQRKFIKDYAKRTKDLYDVMTGKKPWCDDVEDKVNAIKDEIIRTEGLCLPIFGQPFIVETDASEQAIGAVLKQVQEGKERILRYASRTYHGAESRYSTIERETLAIVFALQQFRVYLCNKFLLRTDHKPLVWLRDMTDPQGRVARWIMFSSDFNFEIEHISGERNNWADMMSRPECLTLGKGGGTQDAENYRKLVIDAHVNSGIADVMLRTCSCGNEYGSRGCIACAKR
ncbi:hypothetical protein PAEPH01_2605, partial [Pancytospora epiphaga]